MRKRNRFAVVLAGLAVVVAATTVACWEGGPSTAPSRRATPEPRATEPARTQAPSTPTSPVDRGSASPTLTPTPAASRTYTVIAGDVCWRIAEAHGVTTADLMRANPRINAECSNLRIGWELVIPGEEPPAGA